MLAVGTYDGAIVGWRRDGAGRFQLGYAFSAHDGSVRCMAMGGRHNDTLVTGGSDEMIRVFSLQAGRQVGTLLHHNATVTALAFAGHTHLLSGAQDGELCFWRAHDWTLVLSMKGHKGSVDTVSVHPSGRVALTVDSTKTLRLWDLTKGRPAFATQLGYESLSIAWLEEGSAYMILSPSTVQLYDGTSGTMRTKLEHKVSDTPLKLHCATYTNTGDAAYVIAGAEGGELIVWNVATGASGSVATGHSGRVKSVGVLPAAAAAASSSSSAGGAGSSDKKDKRPGASLQLMTCGADSVVCVWPLADVLAASGVSGGKASSAALKPLETLTYAKGNRATVATCSIRSSSDAKAATAGGAGGAGGSGSSASAEEASSAAAAAAEDDSDDDAPAPKQKALQKAKAGSGSKPVRPRDDSGEGDRRPKKKRRGSEGGK